MRKLVNSEIAKWNALIDRARIPRFQEAQMLGAPSTEKRSSSENRPCYSVIGRMEEEVPRDLHRDKITMQHPKGEGCKTKNTPKKAPRC